MAILSLKKSNNILEANSIATEEQINSKLFKIKNKTILSKVLYGTSCEDIDIATCIARNKDNKIESHSCHHKGICIGIAINDYKNKERIGFITYGKLTHPSLKFSASYGKPVYVGGNGVPTDVMPNIGKCNVIGFSIDANTMFVTLDANSTDKILIPQKYVRISHNTRWTIPITKSKIAHIQVVAKRKNNNIIIAPKEIIYYENSIDIILPERDVGFVTYSILS